MIFSHILGHVWRVHSTALVCYELSLQFTKEGLGQNCVWLSLLRQQPIPEFTEFLAI